MLKRRRKWVKISQEKIKFMGESEEEIVDYLCTFIRKK